MTNSVIFINTPLIYLVKYIRNNELKIITNALDSLNYIIKMHNNLTQEQRITTIKIAECINKLINHVNIKGAEPIDVDCLRDILQV